MQYEYLTFSVSFEKHQQNRNKVIELSLRTQLGHRIDVNTEYVNNCIFLNAFPDYSLPLERN
jgi:hypothetical protein